jgi:hypothetical protein
MSFRTAYGYTHSENGWRMCNRDECERIFIPGANNTFLAAMIVRKGDAEVILRAWAIWYHNNVEPLDRYQSGVGDDWGWSATNDVPNSNHLSGTALDFNASQYPWGSRTMPQARIAKVREGLRLFEGTIFWGADWSRADEMHYQIGFREGDKRISDFANRLRRGHLGLIAPEPNAKPLPNLINIEAERAKSWIGKRETQGEIVTPDKVGRWAKFENGYIYFHPKTGAHAIPLAIFEKWAKLGWETSFIGYPTKDHAVTEAGEMQAFQNGAIYKKKGQPAFHVRGMVAEYWNKVGAEKGVYGWPVSDEQGHKDGTFQLFEGGRIYWTPGHVLGVPDSKG